MNFSVITLPSDASPQASFGAHILAIPLRGPSVRPRLELGVESFRRHAVELEVFIQRVLNSLFKSFRVRVIHFQRRANRRNHYSVQVGRAMMIGNQRAASSQPIRAESPADGADERRNVEDPKLNGDKDGQSNGSKKLLVTFDVKSFSALESVRDDGHYGSFAEAIRDSIRLSRTVQMQAKEGFYELSVRNPKTGAVKIIIASHLLPHQGSD